MASLSALLVWALAAGCALFWYLRAGGAGQPGQAPAAGGMPAGGLVVDTRMVASALGAVESAPQAAPVVDVTNRLALRGIVTHGGRGAALIAVDGKPPKPLRVGAALEGADGWKVHSLSPDAVVIAAGERQVRLEMPPLAQRSGAGGMPPPAPAGRLP
ncbi:MAG: type II secretion system protein N [Pseudomonadota bacterium]|nr:type II secretion system protein N [Pseudomonadota bacterium]